MELCASAAGGRAADPGALPGGIERGDSRDLAAALWNGRSDRRRIFRARGAGDGIVFHDARCGGAVLPRILEYGVPCRRIRRTASDFRIHYRQEVRWLEITRLARKLLRRGCARSRAATHFPISTA